MKKRKKFLLTAALLTLIFIGALLAAPLFFKEDIKKLVIKEANENLNARVYFGDVGLSFIRNFPNATISISDFGVVGKGFFAKDTLAQGKSFKLVVDLWSIISGGDPTIKKITLDKPTINVIVLKDGTANYDITLPDPAPVAAAEATTNFNLKLNEYSIKEGNITYDDATLPMRAEIRNITHSGAGNFTADTYDLSTKTIIDQLSVAYDGTKYLNKSSIDADLGMNISMLPNNMIIIFGDNKVKLNELAMTFSGNFSMPGEDIKMDMKFAALENTFKSVLSLVPGIYTESFKDLKTDGTFALDGFVRGTYNEKQIPGFGLNLKVENGYFQYPSLPAAVRNIATDLSVKNPDGDIEKTAINIRKFHIDFGQNPVDLRGTFEGIARMKVNAEAKAKLNLAELTKMFPIEGNKLSGLFFLEATANGIYDTLAKTFPKVNAAMNLTNGYAKNSDYPAELTQLNFNATMRNQNGSLAETVLDVSQFAFLLDGTPLAGRAHIEDFDAMRYDISGKGKLNLEKLMQVYPIEGMKLRGIVTLNDFYTRGSYADVEAEKYINLKTGGDAIIENFRYDDITLKYPVTIDYGQATFTPDKININAARGMIGKSDYEVTGFFSNYVAYALMENEPIEGQMTMKCKKLDLNNLMDYDATAPAVAAAAVASTTASTQPAAETPMEVIPVPSIFNIGFNADIAQVLYDTYDIRNMRGGLKVADEAVQMQNVVFDLIGGKFTMNGTYDTKNVRQPLYDFKMAVDDVALKRAYESFTTVKKLMPIAQYMDGMGDFNLGIGGKLGPDMMPLLETTNGEGLFAILQTAIKGSPIIDGLAAKTKLSVLNPLTMKDVKGSFVIENGNVTVKPFDIKMGESKATVSGSQNLGGMMDFDVNFDIPSGKAGAAAYSALGALTGGKVKPSDRTQMKIKLTGKAPKPDIRIVSVGGEAVQDTKQQAAETGKNLLQDQIQKQTGANVNLDQFRKDSIQKALQQQKAAATQRAKDSLDAIKRKAEEAAKAKEAELKKKAEEEAKKQLNNLKGKIGFPK